MLLGEPLSLRRFQKNQKLKAQTVSDDEPELSTWGLRESWNTLPRIESTLLTNHSQDSLQSCQFVIPLVMKSSDQQCECHREGSKGEAIEWKMTLDDNYASRMKASYHASMQVRKTEDEVVEQASDALVVTVKTMEEVVTATSNRGEEVSSNVYK